jgi:hypothetical protein
MVESPADSRQTVQLLKGHAVLLQLGGQYMEALRGFIGGKERMRRLRHILKKFSKKFYEFVCMF